MRHTNECRCHGDGYSTRSSEYGYEIVQLDDSCEDWSYGLNFSGGDFKNLKW
jgi:hypothetical protein